VTAWEKMWLKKTYTIQKICFSHHSVNIQKQILFFLRQWRIRLCTV